MRIGVGKRCGKLLSELLKDRWVGQEMEGEIRESLGCEGQHYYL